MSSRPIDCGNVNACDYIWFVFVRGWKCRNQLLVIKSRSFTCLSRWLPSESVRKSNCFAGRFVLLQMAAMKLLGFLMPRVVTHNLYSDTPGGWVMPMKFYVTIITGWDNREVFRTQASTTAESPGFMRSYPPQASCSLRCNWCWPYLEHAPTMQMKLCIQNWTKILRWSLFFFLMLTLPASPTVILAKV